MAERDAELGQVLLAKVRQDVEIDIVLGEQLGAPAEADLPEPLGHPRHASSAAFLLDRSTINTFRDKA
jgi:hypothetical protein